METNAERYYRSKYLSSSFEDGAWIARLGNCLLDWLFRFFTQR